MELMKLSDVCKQYHFTRRVIQGYEKEGLVKKSGRNKYGHLVYDKKQVKKIAYIRYLQINGLTLKEIAKCLEQGNDIKLSRKLLNSINNKHKKEISRLLDLIKNNEEIIKCKTSNQKIFNLIMEEIKNGKTN